MAWRAFFWVMMHKWGITQHDSEIEFEGKAAGGKETKESACKLPVL